MRRSERETTPQEALQILEGCAYLTLAVKGDDFPYAVPVHFGMEMRGGMPALYFHGARAGKKHALLAADGRVAFSAVRFCENVPPAGEAACTATARYESVCGEGRAACVEGAEAEHGLMLLLSHAGMGGALPRAAVEKTCVCRIDVCSLHGKRHD